MVQKYINSFLDKYTNYKEYWNYEDGCVLVGCQQLYEATGDEKYRKFILDYLAPFIEEDGTINNFPAEKYSIDSFNCSKILFFAYKETKDEKYKKAIDYSIHWLMKQPRTSDGNFIHKAVYPAQVWLDGLYMAQPFYMQYETVFNKKENYNDILSQFRNVRKYMFDNNKKLYYHGYDSDKIQSWADKETGLSANFWLRSIGWYLIALIDTIDNMSQEMYEHYRELCDIFREAIDGILSYRDKESGLFYQVVDCHDNKDNYTETSGSAMIAYAVMKAARLEVISFEKYADLGADIFDCLVKEKLVKSEDNDEICLCDICKVAGLGPGEQRDGSIRYYLSEPRVSDDSKGTGPFIMAYAQKIMLDAEKQNRN